MQQGAAGTLAQAEIMPGMRDTMPSHDTARGAMLTHDASMDASSRSNNGSGLETSTHIAADPQAANDVTASTGSSSALQQPAAGTSVLIDPAPVVPASLSRPHADNPLILAQQLARIRPAEEPVSPLVSPSPPTVLPTSPVLVPTVLSEGEKEMAQLCSRLTSRKSAGAGLSSTAVGVLPEVRTGRVHGQPELVLHLTEAVAPGGNKHPESLSDKVQPPSLAAMLDAAAVGVECIMSPSSPTHSRSSQPNSGTKTAQLAGPPPPASVAKPQAVADHKQSEEQSTTAPTAASQAQPDQQQLDTRKGSTGIQGKVSPDSDFTFSPPTTLGALREEHVLNTAFSRRLVAANRTVSDNGRSSQSVSDVGWAVSDPRTRSDHGLLLLPGSSEAGGLGEAGRIMAEAAHQLQQMRGGDASAAGRGLMPGLREAVAALSPDASASRDVFAEWLQDGRPPAVPRPTASSTNLSSNPHTATSGTPPTLPRHPVATQPHMSAVQRQIAGCMADLHNGPRSGRAQSPSTSHHVPIGRAGSSGSNTARASSGDVGMPHMAGARPRPPSALGYMRPTSLVGDEGWGVMGRPISSTTMQREMQAAGSRDGLGSWGTVTRAFVPVEGEIVRRKKASSARASAHHGLGPTLEEQIQKDGIIHIEF